MNKGFAGLLLAFFGIAAGGGPLNAQLKASGTMYFVFDMSSETTVDGVLFARFAPDPRSLRSFSSVTSGGYSAAVRFVSLEPAQEVLEAALGKAEAYRVSHGTAPREIGVPVQVVLTGYKTEVECDSRVYRAKLLSIKTTGKHFEASGGNAPHGC